MEMVINNWVINYLETTAPSLLEFFLLEINTGFFSFFLGSNLGRLHL